MICQLYHGYLQGLSMFPRPLIGYKCGLLYCYFSDCQPKVDETLVDLIAYLQEEVSNFPICKQGLKKKPHRLKMFTKVYKPIQTGPKKQGESTTTKRLKAQLLLFESYLVAGRLHRDQEKQQYFGNCLIRLQE